MAKAMKKYTESASESNAILSIEERNLLSVAYKHVIGALRNTWRILSSCESRASKLKTDDAEAKVKITQEYRQEIEKELSDMCCEALVGIYFVFISTLFLRPFWINT